MFRKTSFLIVIIVAVVAMAVLILYFFVFRNRPDNSTSANNAVSTGLTNSGDSAVYNPAQGLGSDQPVPAGRTPGSPSEEELSQEMPLINRVVNTDVVGATLANESGRLIYYDALDQMLVSVDFLGLDPIFLRGSTEQASQINWVADKSKMVYTSPEGEVFFLNVITGEEEKLGQKILDPQFADGADQIVYHYVDAGAAVSNISVGSGEKQLSDYRVLAQMKGRLMLQAIPATGLVAYCLQPAQGVTSMLYTVNVANGNQELLLNQAEGMAANWNNGGTKMVYTQRPSGGSLQLFIADGNGRNTKILPKTTFVDKIAWDNNADKIFLAVPQRIPTLDEYYGQEKKTQDIFYEYDLTSGAMNQLFDVAKIIPGKQIDAHNMFLSHEGQLLFFENSYDHGLYVVNVRKARELK